MLPHAAHTREVVLQLSELNLELSLGGDGVLREDVENELRPVDHAQLELVLEPPLLAGIEIAVDDQRLGLHARNGLLELGQLSLADVRARIGRRPPLNYLTNGLDPRGAHELPHLPQLLVLIHSLRQYRDEKAALRLGSGRGVRLVLRHGLIMPSL